MSFYSRSLVREVGQLLINIGSEKIAVRKTREITNENTFVYGFHISYHFLGFRKHLTPPGHSKMFRIEIGIGEGRAKKY